MTTTIEMTAEVTSGMASRLFAPAASSTTGVIEEAIKKSAELWRETRKRVINEAPDLLVHLPPEDREVQRVVDRIAVNAATIYPTANMPDQNRVETVVKWAVEIYARSRKGQSTTAQAGAE